MKVLHIKKDRTERVNRRGISLVGYAGEELLKVIAGRRSDYCERDNILPEDQCGFTPQRSTVEMTFLVRRLQAPAQKKNAHLYVCFIDLTKEHDSVHRTYLWGVPDWYGVPPKEFAVIRELRDGMPRMRAVG